MNVMDVNPRAVPGDNNPPPIRDILAEKHGHAIQDLEAIATRANAAPKEIKDDADLVAVSTIVSDARALVKKLDSARTAEKEPYLSGGREVDGYFREQTDRLDRIVNALTMRATEYQRAKAAEARRLAEEKERAEREEADRQRRIADEEAARSRPIAAAKHEAKAEAAEDRAAEAAAKAQTAAADTTRVRAAGVTVSARTEWTFEITDWNRIDLNALRPHFKREDVEKAIRQYVRNNKGSAPLAGVRVYEDVKANIR